MTLVLSRMVDYLRKSFKKREFQLYYKTISIDKTGHCEGVCVRGGYCLVRSKMLSLYDRIISDPNQSPSDISSVVLLKIILSPGHCTDI